jgi:hypothetical protein
MTGTSDSSPTSRSVVAATVKRMVPLPRGERDHSTKRRGRGSRIREGDKSAAETALRDVSRKYDKAVSKGVLHKNNAANKKSFVRLRFFWDLMLATGTPLHRFTLIGSVRAHGRVCPR